MGVGGGQPTYLPPLPPPPPTPTHSHSRHWSAVPLFTAVMLGFYSVARHPPGVFTDTSQREPPRYPAPLSATQHRPNCKHWFSTSWTEGRRVREGRAWSLQPQAGLLRHVFVTTARFVTKLTKRVKSDAPPARFVTLVTKRAVVTKRAATPAKVSTESASSHARSRRKGLLYQPTNLTQIREVTVPVHLFSEEGEEKKKYI